MHLYQAVSHFLEGKTGYVRTTKNAFLTAAFDYSCSLSPCSTTLTKKLEYFKRKDEVEEDVTNVDKRISAV